MNQGPFTTITVERFYAMQDALLAADELAETVRAFWKEDITNWPDVQRALMAFEKKRAKQK